MDFSQVGKNPGRKLGGLVFVIALHIFIFYALVSGLARDAVEIIKAPLEAAIIEELKPPPPPELPPSPPPPKMTAPPPFVPPVETPVQPPVQVNTITAVAREEPPETVMPPIQPPAVAAAPAAPATPAAPAAPVRRAAVVDSSACVTPEYPPRALRNGETGVVTLQFLIGIDGRVVESRVDRSSGHRDLDIAARNALSLCRFKPGTVDGTPEQSWTRMQYVWKLE